MSQVVDDQQIAAAGSDSENDAHASEGDCPPPLSWQEVLAEVSQQSESWRLEREGAAITGRTFGSGRPLFLLHGVLGNWELFALTMWLLREEFQTIVVETSPHSGRLSARRFSVEALADDLLAAADHFALQRADLFASSFGCLPALTAMRQQPGRFERAVLHAGRARCPLSLTERALLQIGRWCPGSLRRVPMFNRIQTYNHRRWFPPFDESRWDFLLRNIGATPTSQLAARLSALKTVDLRPILPAIPAPVLLLHGEGDPQSARDRQADLLAGLPHAETKQLSHCGQFPFVTHPHILSRALKDYLLPADEPSAQTSVTTAPHEHVAAH